MPTAANYASASVASSGTAVRTVLYLGALMAFAAGLAFFYFSQSSLRLDEAQSLWQSGRSALDILKIVAQDVHVPLYYELLHFWRLTVGDSVGAARFLSLIFYLALIPAMYLLGKMAYGRDAGLYAALLIAISPFMNWYGSEIRMYTLFAFLVIVNQYLFIKLWKNPTDNAWIAYILTALCGIFTHYFFLLTLLAQAVFYVARRDIFPKEALGRFVFSWGFLALCFAPWALFVLLQGQAANASPVLSAPTTVNLFNAFAQFLFGFHDDHLSTIFLSLWPLTVVIGFFALRKSTRMEPVTQYLMLSVILGVAVAFIVSLALAPVFVSRYLIFTIPSLYLLLTSLFSLYPPRGARIARGALVGLMALMLGLEIMSPTTPVKENYREAAAYLTDHAAPQDIVILSAPFTVYPIEYYYRGAAPLATLPLWDRYAYGPIPPFDEAALPEEVRAATENYQYAWMLFSYDQGYEDSIRQYMENNYERVGLTTFSPGMELAVYKIRYDTPLSRTAPAFSLAR